MLRGAGGRFAGVVRRRGEIDQTAFTDERLGRRGTAETPLIVRIGRARAADTASQDAVKVRDEAGKLVEFIFDVQFDRIRILPPIRSKSAIGA